ncbi:hypothetical protein FisN_9Lh257 [Fistulifera solaris]|uniref:Uncharacterized protein n=1 Tax=Fistulifera solaris TaxID=1519565 RepID=A0A1Z5KKW6_FISSO|nr:hypothetical protein FisN_9Lh257 [Fistulifera solaris]|eukprot:GAX26953.1 hypothetical protein FisN_9Lh257 [Fistulifera solaris]
MDDKTMMIALNLANEAEIKNDTPYAQCAHFFTISSCGQGSVTKLLVSAAFVMAVAHRNPNSLTAVATIPGTPTCGDLYWIAKNGNLEERMCRPMQNYFATPCGCLSGGNGGGGAPDIPVPAPVRATVPVATPTRAVVPTPSSAAYPPKQPVPNNASKDDEKLYGTDVRGNLHKKRKLAPKGQTLRGTAN